MTHDCVSVRRQGRIVIVTFDRRNPFNFGVEGTAIHLRYLASSRLDRCPMLCRWMGG